MPTQAKTGARTPQKAVSPPKQTQRIPSIRADVYWMNPNEDESIRANASLTIGDAFKVGGIKVVSGTKGDFVSMPSYKSGDVYKDIFHAVTKEARDQMNAAVMTAYEQKLAEEQTQDQEQGDEPAADAPEESAQEEGAGMSMQ